jgi:hypothetical protein
MSIINQKAALVLLRSGVGELLIDSNNYVELAKPFRAIKPGQSFRLIVFGQLEPDIPLLETTKLYAYCAEKAVDPFDEDGDKLAVFPEDAVGIIYGSNANAVRFNQQYVGVSISGLRTAYRKLVEDKREGTHEGHELLKTLLCFYGNHDQFLQEMRMLVELRDC